MLSTLPLALANLLAIGQESVDFDRDVRPILSDNCFVCHGPDASSREADLRLDLRENATADRGGYAAVAPGDLERSELWKRVTSELSHEVMPPPDSHKPPLGARELALLEEWIEGGAAWARHWAFVPPVRTSLVHSDEHPVDELVRRRLSAEGLDLAPRASVHVLARRLAFDLTGLPPEPERVDALGAGSDEQAWAQYIEELLASPHHGERMAMWWLDGARYADTDGFQADDVRSNWPWRDWVVQAFQEGMPFDEFTIEQFAGDLLPDATPEQILATCFHRNHMHNGEGGRDPEESRVDYVRDRVDTTGTVWLGLTVGCAQCHDHKFDPISQRDYYSLTAFFDSIDESGSAGGGARPFLDFMSPLAGPAVLLAESELARVDSELETQRARARENVLPWLQERRAQARAGFRAWTTLATSDWSTAEGSELALEPDGSVRCLSEHPDQEDYRVTFAATSLERITGLQLEVFEDAGGGLAFSGDGEFILTNVKLQLLREGSSEVRDLELASAVASHIGEGVDKQYGPVAGVLDDDPRTGWTTRTREVTNVARLVVALEEPLRLAQGESLMCILMHRSTEKRAHIRRFRLGATDQPGAAVRSLDPMPMESLVEHLTGAPDSELPSALTERLLDQYLEDDATWQSTLRRRNVLAGQLRSAKRSTEAQKVTVLAERAEPRTTWVLNRGVWDSHGEEVTRALPAAVFANGSENPATRLDLARWIVHADNPLTARVVVNQIWQLLFGAGLVRTPEDLGLQGARPRYPELLDWLAVDFMENGWDLRHLLRRIVTSRTYRQSSATDAGLLERDPHNQLLARGPRFRLPSWMIRDSALAASGLLDRTIGGPPVFPHQPPGVWEDVFMGRIRYQPTLGQARYRRTLYAFWRRNAAPTYLFDSSMRRTCEVGVRRTNTPLQALTLLNDRTYLEAATALASRALDKTPSDPRARAAWMGRRVLSRELEPDELDVFAAVHGEAHAAYTADPEAAALRVMPSSEAVTPELSSHDPVELAAAVVLAGLILNLDEAITHE